MQQFSNANFNSMSRNSNVQYLVKFPSITKLQYQGISPLENSKKLLKVKSTKSLDRQKLGQKIVPLSVLSKASNFRLVQVQPDEYMMKICMMKINEMQNKEKQKQTPQKSLVHQHNKIMNRRQTISVNIASEIPSQQITTKATNKQQGELDFGAQVRKYNRSKTQVKFQISKTIPIPESKINLNQLYYQINTALALINGQIIITQSRSLPRIRRAKIEKGNNGLLVKQMVKRRNWWNTTEEPNDANLIWTEKTINNITSNSEGKYYTQIENAEQQKVIFQKNIGMALSYYPKILQLFFTEQQIEKYEQANYKQKIYHKISKYLSAKRATRKLISQLTVFYNHIPNNKQITAKKNLYINLRRYYNEMNQNIYKYIPKTYHFTAFDWQQKLHSVRTENKRIFQLQTKSKKQQSKLTKAWFLKPGENTNRGKGIQMFKSTTQALDYILRNPPKTAERTYILQQYINPLLYQQRKFDIRCYLLCIQVFDVQTFYWYEQGYIRTSSSKFTMTKTSQKIHLTNDAVQKQYDNYEKYESANKLSYMDIHKYLANQFGYDFMGSILKQMKKIANDVCRSAINMGANINREQSNTNQQSQQLKAQHSQQQYPAVFFQIFGLDYIISKQGTPYLLQVNTNPCLQINNNLLSRIIPEVVENTFRLVLDVFLPNRSINLSSNPKLGNNNNNANAVQIGPDWLNSFLHNNKFSLLYSRKTKTIQNQTSNSPNQKIQKSEKIEEQGNQQANNDNNQEQSRENILKQQFKLVQPQNCHNQQL